MQLKTLRLPVRTVSFSTCFLTDEKFFNCAAGQLRDVLELFDQISLEGQDVR